MEIVLLLLIIAIVAVVSMGWIFFKTLQSGQYDDLESPAHRILMDDETMQDEDESPAKKDD